MKIERQLAAKKAELLSYFRNRAAELVAEVHRTYGSRDFKKQAAWINRAIREAKEDLIKALLQAAANEKWAKAEILAAVLMVTYTSYVVMIESRNDLWP